MNDTPRRGSLASSVGPSTTPSRPQPTLTGRRSMLSLRQSFGASGNPSTPRRGSMTPTQAPALPTPTAASRYATMTTSTGLRRAKPLEIGDEVVMDGTSLIGVLRHLGPVAFKPGEYAGLELIGSSAGKGKNDGSVQGVQYFACDAGDGIFCPAHKVSPLSTEAPTEATGRPQSALSARSGRSSAAGGEYRPPSTTPSLRNRSSTIANISRPPSTTPVRAPSRNAIIRPSSSLSSRPSIGTTPSTSRLQPRKSIADGLADEEGRRRAKSSAEAAEKAEGRITAGSRAHRFLHMNVKDLESNGKTSLSDPFGPEINGKKGSPIKSGRPSSPLKDSLLGGNRVITGMPTPKSRISIGTSGMATPRIAKARASLFGGKSNASSMLPPSLPGNAMSEDLNRSTPIRQSLGVPKTPSRLLRAPLKKGEEESQELTSIPSTNVRDAKNQMLLEELDLTPKRDSRTVSLDGDMSPRQQYEAGNETELGGFAVAMSEGDADGVAQAAVPLTLYEESTLEAARLKAQLKEMTLQLQQSQADVEKARIQAQQEAQLEREEEQRVEREDEERRRRDLEVREKEQREKSESLQKEVKKLMEEVKRVELEKEVKVKDMTTQLRENEKLVEHLKGTLDSGGAKSDEVEGTIKAKDLEMQQLSERVVRLTEERDKEREDHLREMDDLKAAGEEAFEIFQKEQSLSNEIIRETEHKMTMLEARAQEAILEVERERDEALRGIKPTSVAEIDHQSLQEQLRQAEKRVVSLEDQLAESNMVMQQEREINIRRKDRFTELEAKLKGEIAKIRGEYKRVSSSEAEARSRIEELMEAVEESRAALENERAELEILRTEALVIGSGQDDQSASEREKARLEGEIERLNGLLEGSRSGKREASRQVEGHLKEIERLHSLVDEARSHLKNAEADQSALEDRLAKQSNSNDQSLIVDLRRMLDNKYREIEAMHRANISLPEQVSILLESHRKDMYEREEEVVSLRRKLDDALRRQSSSRYSLTVPSSYGPGSEVSLHSPTLSGFGDSAAAGNSSPGNSKRLSGNSNHSRKSRGSMSQTFSASDTTMKEMAGLRSIVNTLNQELTESKVSNMQKERELTSEVEKWKEETRKWQLTVESMRGSESNGSQESKQARSEAITSRLEVEKKLQDALQQVQRYKDRLEAIELKRREEVDKLNQDITDLEALCEATVWRREEQDAKRQELERQVGKLQRNLDRALNGARQEESSSHDEPPMNGKSEIVCDDCGERGHRMGDDCPYNKDDMLF